VVPDAAQDAPAPVEAGERLPTLDVLRGFALLGILLINMEDFSAASVPGLGPSWTDRPDQIVSWVLRFAAEGKFRALFSLLFGMGFALQLQRAEIRQDRFRTLYTRRMLVLLGIGIAHYLLLWEADILMTYALVGLLLLLFRGVTVKTALRAAGSLAGVAVALLSLIALIAHPRPARSHTDGPSPIPAKKVRMVKVYSEGSYGEVVAYRAQQFGQQMGRFVPMVPLTLMLFLLGMAASKAGIVRNPGANQPLLLRITMVCLCLGLLANYLVAVYAYRLMALPPIARVPIAASYVLGGPLLAVAYAGGLTLLMLRPAWRRLLLPLAAPGRLALTNYLIQSVICSCLCYGYGFGLYNHLRPVAAVGLCLVIYLAQIIASLLWLRWYRYGPVEWLWRSLTYRRLLPMRIGPSGE
jgi:uncharacterized protein